MLITLGLQFLDKRYSQKREKRRFYKTLQMSKIKGYSQKRVDKIILNVSFLLNKPMFGYCGFHTQNQQRN